MPLLTLWPFGILTFYVSNVIFLIAIHVLHPPPSSASGTMWHVTLACCKICKPIAVFYPSILTIFDQGREQSCTQWRFPSLAVTTTETPLQKPRGGGTRCRYSKVALETMWSEWLTSLGYTEITSLMSLTNEVWCGKDMQMPRGLGCWKMLSPWQILAALCLTSERHRTWTT